MFTKPKYRRSTGDKIFFSEKTRISGNMAKSWMKDRISLLSANTQGKLCREIRVEADVPQNIAALIPGYESGESGFVLKIGEQTNIYAGAKGIHSAFATLEQLYIEGGVTETLLWDKPFCDLRGYRLYTPAREQIDLFKNTVDMLAYYRFNAIIIEVGGAMEYKSHPEINEGWVKYCADIRSKSGRSLEIQEHSYDWQKNSIHH